MKQGISGKPTLRLSSNGRFNINNRSIPERTITVQFKGVERVYKKKIKGMEIELIIGEFNIIYKQKEMLLVTASVRSIRMLLGYKCEQPMQLGTYAFKGGQRTFYLLTVNGRVMDDST